jgi:hypothetical protein
MDEYGATVEWRLASENRRTRRKTCCSATSSTKNLTLSHPGLNPGLHVEKPAPRRLSYGTAYFTSYKRKIGVRLSLRFERERKSLYPSRYRGRFSLSELLDRPTLRVSVKLELVKRRVRGWWVALVTYSHSETEGYFTWGVEDKLNRAVAHCVHVLPNPLILSSATHCLTCLSHIRDGVVLHELRILSSVVHAEMCPFRVILPIRIWSF